MNTLILARQRRHNCTWNNCSIWTDVEVFYMVWEIIDLEFITKYSLPKMFRILFWMEVGTTRVRVHCIMHASTKIKFNLKWLICLEHLLEIEPNLQPSSPNFKYSVTKYFLTLSIYINTSWSQSRNMFIMLIQAQVYIITLTLSHEYFRNRKQETNYHILSVGQESLRIMHNDILYAHRAFPREYCQFGQTTSSCCYKIIILFSLQHNTFPCKNPRRILFKNEIVFAWLWRHNSMVYTLTGIYIKIWLHIFKTLDVAITYIRGHGVWITM